MNMNCQSDFWDFVPSVQARQDPSHPPEGPEAQESWQQAYGPWEPMPFRPRGGPGTSEEYPRPSGPPGPPGPPDHLGPPHSRPHGPLVPPPPPHPRDGSVPHPPTPPTPPEEAPGEHDGPASPRSPHADRSGRGGRHHGLGRHHSPHHRMRGSHHCRGRGGHRGGMFGGPPHHTPPPFPFDFRNLDFNNFDWNKLIRATGFLLEPKTAEPKPAVDVFQNGSSYIIHASVPGATKSSVDVQWHAASNSVVIEGELETPDEVTSEMAVTAIMQEMKTGQFKREVKLPGDAYVDVEGITAKLEHGILRIEVPKEKEGWSEITKVTID